LINKASEYFLSQPSSSSSISPSISESVADKRVHTMTVRAKAPQLHLFAVLDLLRITVAPFYGDFRVGVSVDEDVEGAVSVQDREEGHGCGDLAEDRLNLVLDFFLGFFLCLRGGVDGTGVSSPLAIGLTTISGFAFNPTYLGLAFSLSADFPESRFWDDLPKIWT
jgi:hypothetical protein